MSLDVSLITKEPVIKSGTGVFIREDGKRRELSVAEVKEKWPESDIDEQEYASREMFDSNITHNLSKMAVHAELYEALWRPDEQGWKYARDIIPKLETGLKALKDRPDYYKSCNPDNGWGSYDGLVSFVERYLAACREYPDAEIEVSR
jgi:hypothetical protein